MLCTVVFVSYPLILNIINYYYIMYVIYFFRNILTYPTVPEEQDVRQTLNELFVNIGYAGHVFG